jgi:hypothetical protein
MPNDWLLALVGIRSRVFNIVNTLPIKISKIYVIDPSNERHDEIRHKRSPPLRL